MKTISGHLQTKRLSLRPLELSDRYEVFFLRSDKTVNQFIKRPEVKTVSDVIPFMERIQQHTKNQHSYYWCIALTEDPDLKMIGSICLWNFSEDRRTAEVGYDLHPDFHGKGIMTEALQKIIEVGFKELRLDTIEAFTHRDNKKSIQLLEKSAFGHLPERVDDDNPDNVIFEIRNPCLVNRNTNY